MLLINFTNRYSVLSGLVWFLQNCQAIAVCPFLRARGSGTDERLKLVHIPCLHIDRTRASETANKTLACLHTAHETTASLFDFVVAAPGNQVAIIDNMLLSRFKLREC